MLTQALVSLLLIATPTSSYRDKAKDSNVDAELVVLAQQLDSAEGEAAVSLILAFADQHRPTKTPVAVFVSKDKAICIAIAANASAKVVDGRRVEFKPTGTKYNIAIGSTGFDSDKGVGGNGGDVRLTSKATGKAILIGGSGGKGADGKAKEAGKSGGNGGNVWFGDYLKDGDIVVGGRAGSGGNGGLNGGAGGSSGRGGSTGSQPPK